MILRWSQANFILSPKILAFLLISISSTWMLRGPVTSDAFWQVMPYVEISRTRGLVEAALQILNVGLNFGRPSLSFIGGTSSWLVGVLFAELFGIPWAITNTVLAVSTIFLSLFILSRLAPELSWLRNIKADSLLLYFAMFYTLVASSNFAFFHDPLSVFYFNSWIVMLLPLYSYLYLLRVKRLQASNNKLVKNIYCTLLVLLLASNGYEANIPATIFITLALAVSIYKMRMILVPHLIFFVLLVASTLASTVYWALRILVWHPIEGYSGTQSDFNLLSSIKVIVIQIVMGVPGVNPMRTFLENWHMNGPIFDFSRPNPMLTNTSIFLCLGISIFLLISIYSSRSKIDFKRTKQDNNQFLVHQTAIVVGICIAPMVTFSFSQKYITEIPKIFTFYMGYSIFLVLCMLASTYLFSRFKVELKSKLLIPVTCLCLLTASGNQFGSQLVVVNQSKLNLIEKALVTEVSAKKACDAVASVKELNYANLGIQTSRMLTDLLVAKKRIISCQ